MASAGGTHGARNPAQGGIGWHCAAAAGTITVRVIAGERPIGPGNEKRPQQDSNLRSRLRRAHAPKALTCTDLPSNLTHGDRLGIDRPGRLTCPCRIGQGLSGKDDPRQASADDDAGKCSGGDRL